MPIRNARPQRIIPLMILLTLALTVFLPSSFAQEDNICRASGAVFIEDGETLVGTLDPNFPISFFCFEAERGLDVTVTITPLTTNLSTILVVGTPFLTNEGALADDPLLVVESPANGNSYDGTVSISSDGTYLILVQGAANVQGAFEITIESSGGITLGVPTEGAGDDDPENNSNDTETEEPSNVIEAEELGLCSEEFSEPLDYNEEVEDTFNGEPVLYCFEAFAGDVVSVTLGIDDVPMVFLVIDPFFDNTNNVIVYAQGVNEDEGEETTIEFVVPADGNYVLLVANNESAEGDFTLTITNSVANIYTCQNEPLNLLMSRQWGIVDEAGTPLIEINVSCSGRMIVTALGGSIVSLYTVNQSGEFIFRYENRFFVTLSLSDTEWVIQREDDGQEFTLTALTDADTCAEEDLAILISGSWLWEINRDQQVYLDFTCNGLVILDDQENEPIAIEYEFEDETIRIFVGGEPLVFEDVRVDEDELDIEWQGIDFDLNNVLYEEETEE